MREKTSAINGMSLPKLPFASGRRRAVGAREGKGYAVPAPRNFIFRMYLKTAPKGVTVQGKKVKKVKPERLEENPDDDTESMVWSWDKATGICSLRMPDRGEESQISLRL